MGLTIHWNWQGPKSRDEARTAIEQLRQRALDLPFEAVSEVVNLQGDDATFHHCAEEDAFGWLKTQARHTVWNRSYTTGWDCMPLEIIAFEILVASGSEPMNVILATYPKTIMIEDERTGRQMRLRTDRHGWSGRGFTKTQYASDPQCGGIPNFLRAHLSVCRMLEHATDIGLIVEVSDESQFYEKRDIQSLVETVGQWNQQIAAFVGVMMDISGRSVEGPIRSYPNFEHLEAKGQNQVEALLRMLKYTK